MVWIESYFSCNAGKLGTMVGEWIEGVIDEFATIGWWFAVVGGFVLVVMLLLMLITLLSK